MAVVVATIRTRKREMDIETEVTNIYENEPVSPVERICKRIEEKMDEAETNYTDFYWYLWEQDSGNGAS